MPFIMSECTSDTAVMVEGEAFYQLLHFTLPTAAVAPAASPGLPTAHSNNYQCPSADTAFEFSLRAYRTLPPCDAIALLSGEDETGLVVWAGALAFVEWLIHAPEMLRDHVCGGSGASLVELGCGSGAVTVAVRKLLAATLPSTEEATPRNIRMFATDGNVECVSLSQRNIEEQGRSTLKDGIECRAELLLWGRQGSSDHLDRYFEHRPSKAVVLSADVIYSLEAVSFLVETVKALYASFCQQQRQTPQQGTHQGFEWWLLYTPRSLSRASNEEIFDRLTSTLAELAECGWRVQRIPLPAGSITSGFEAERDVVSDALLGCIFIISMD